MTSRLAAVFWSSPEHGAAAPVSELPVGLRRTDVGFGSIAQAFEVPIGRDARDICFSFGRPEFDDPDLSALVLAHGEGMAWLSAFRRFGLDAPAHARGRFAVVVAAAEAPCVMLASDRFGTWPLCFTATPHRFAFSDRADCVPARDKQIDAQAIFDYLYFHVIPSPRTIFRGVERLAPGTVLCWQQGKLSRHTYWKPVFDEHRAADFEASKQTFLSVVESAVEREAKGQRVAAFLSGGTDSSTVSGMLCKVLGQPARTYSIGFDASGYDEMEYARIAAKHFGTDHHEYYVTPNDLLEGIPKVAVHYDQPFGNSSAVPAWFCARLAQADGAEKMLAGDGGDELFGGNTRYAKQRIFGAYEKVPGALRGGVLEPLLALPGTNRLPFVRKGVSYVEQARVPMPDRMHMYNLLSRLGLDNVFTPGFLQQVDPDGPAAAQRDVWQAVRAESQINRMLAYDWKYTLSDNDLPKVVGTTQLVGMDVGFPLLSDELLDFSLRLPPEWKLKRLTLRWFFKEALRGFLPDEILAKKKHGFGLPFGVWACSHPGLRSMARDALGLLKSRGIVRAEFIDRLLDTHLPAHPGYYGEMVWILMVLEFWLQAHAPETRIGAQ